MKVKRILTSYSTRTPRASTVPMECIGIMYIDFEDVNTEDGFNLESVMPGVVHLIGVLFASVGLSKATRATIPNRFVDHEMLEGLTIYLLGNNKPHL